MNSISFTLLCSMISGIIGVIISNIYYKKYEKKKLKFDVLKNIMGYRYIMTTMEPTKEDHYFFSALNEVFIVYNDCPQVIEAIKKYHDNLSNLSNLLDLIKRMCDELKIDYSFINDEFINKPFRTGSKK
ncbi:DUF6680 family protein [Clostridium botulinum]|uniref:DUF6680 family protein n=1 Tax=Clostridium botulinum TaxID=1491 RepID=UPI0009473E14|nr:DUF6680 family protein [Clostridium botulinum]APQ96454.1 hypothetical protein RSJ3_2015 [Clostridium botulinum]MBN3361704.1 hypothetical protein [Clostridium botulinum]